MHAIVLTVHNLFTLDRGSFYIKPATKSRNLSVSTHEFPHTTIQGSLMTGSISWMDFCHAYRIAISLGD